MTSKKMTSQKMTSKNVISRLFSLPLRALVVAAVLPPASALGAELAGPGVLFRPATVERLDRHAGFETASLERLHHSNAHQRSRWPISPTADAA